MREESLMRRKGRQVIAVMLAIGMTISDVPMRCFRMFADNANRLNQLNML